MEEFLNNKLESHREIEIILRNLFNDLMPLESIEEKIPLSKVIEQIKEYQKWIFELKKEFGIKKNYSMEHIAEQIFSKKIFDKNMCKMHILTMEIAIKDIYDDLLHLSEQNENLDIHNHVIKGKLALLNDVILDINELIWKCKESFLNQPQTAKSYRRRLFDSREIFSASKDLLRRYFYYNDISFSSISVFLIRQSIEIKVLNCLGIFSIIDKDKMSKKFKLETLLDFIDKNENIEFPIKKSLLLKIIKWSNSYIHRGLMHYHWEIILVHKVLQPLFTMGVGKTTMSLNGAVKINKEYFENKLYEDLLKCLDFNVDETEIIKIKPEAIIE